MKIEQIEKELKFLFFPHKKISLTQELRAIISEITQISQKDILQAEKKKDINEFLKELKEKIENRKEEKTQISEIDKIINFYKENQFELIEIEDKNLSEEINEILKLEKKAKNNDNINLLLENKKRNICLKYDINKLKESIMGADKRNKMKR